MTAIADSDCRSGVLAAARAGRAAEIAATAEQLRLASVWAAMHAVASLDEAAVAEVFGERVVPIAGPGAPLVGEFCVAELAAALGLPTDHGRWLLGEAVELEHRLPQLWRRVMAHELPAWRARRIARRTMELSAEAAAFVDRQIAHVAHRVGAAVVDHRQVSFSGTSKVYGELDLADALDLDAAVVARAAHLKELGSSLRPPEAPARRCSTSTWAQTR